MNVGILGIGRYVPEKVVTNHDLEKIMETSDEWIRTRTGIAERRIADDTIDTSYMAVEASKKALEDAGISGEDIDLILVATVTPDRAFPAVACVIQEAIGAKHAAAMDLSAACAGFMYGMITAQQFIQTGTYKNVLVVGSDKLSKIVDWNDRNTAVLFGDGAGAGFHRRAGCLPHGSGGKHLYQDEYVMMNGREVFKFAVRQLGDSCLRVLDKAGLTKEDVDFLVPHQANIRIMESARERLNLPQEKMSMTIEKFGNTSASSIPIAMVEELQNGRIQDGDLIILVGFGGGLTWGAVALRWGK